MSKENAENANMKTEEQKPVNTRELGKDEEPEEKKSAFSTEAMLEIAATNEKYMSAKTKSLQADWIKYRDANPGFMGEQHEDFGLSIMYLAGNIMNDKAKGKNDKYISNDSVPGAIMIKSLSDPKMKIRMPVTFAIAVAHYLRPFIDSIPEASHFSVALEREINMRRADSNVFDLGK